MLDWSLCPAVEREPKRVSGAWVFKETRVPVAALFENLEDGVQISEFVEWFPGVSLNQVRTVLEYVAQSSNPGFRKLHPGYLLRLLSADLAN